ncbi:ArdC-like ssDNA-binding domain-containing protein [Acidithiobacillus ferriphilus]|uniref:ArdC-like ssDNA-binding domain-containing protein n=1 Tax=Acidithiobacillus ferriphilus TaxID=1689834 RepID=UPI001D00F0A0|nr:ArdC family protein [Acidithiobacillus ferriphilus]
MASRGKVEKRDYRLEVVDRLIQQIEQGTARWQRPWKPGEILPPVNAVTGKPYRGVNYENLMAFLSPALPAKYACTASASAWTCVLL